MTKRLGTLIGLTPILLSLACSGFSGETLDAIMRSGKGGALDEATVAAGLKEALRVGTERTVGRTSALDGFLGNALIRVLMPEPFQDAASTLRRVGFDKQVDEFEVAMNRAAERAAGEATPVFFAAVKKMTIADAFGILQGSDTAATEYFRDRTSEELRGRFHPIVQAKMQEVGLYNMYKDLTDVYNKLPLVTEPALDLDAHITDRALAGLFTVLGEEEQRIRDDPGARTTELLRKVFE